MTTPLSELIKNDLNVIKNSLIVPVFKFSVPYTNNTTPILNDTNNIVEQYKSGLSYLGNIPLLAKSVFLSYDSTFAQYYSLYIELNGLNIDNNEFTPPPAASSGYDYVPTGASYFVPAGSKLRVFAYNSGGATTNGTLNILAVFDRLDTYNEK
jgi:hypothetical protein